MNLTQNIKTCKRLSLSQSFIGLFVFCRLCAFSFLYLTNAAILFIQIFATILVLLEHSVLLEEYTDINIFRNIVLLFT